jgi:hypothetical protein
MRHGSYGDEQEGGREKGVRDLETAWVDMAGRTAGFRI